MLVAGSLIYHGGVAAVGKTTMRGKPLCLLGESEAPGNMPCKLVWGPIGVLTQRRSHEGGWGGARPDDIKI